jgi:hypothetical protein
MPRALCRIIWVPSTIVVFAMIFLFARQPLAIPPPAEMADFTTEDKVISLRHPGNWKEHANSIHGNYTEVWFEPVRNSEFNVKADLAGSLMADIAKSTSASGSAILDSMPGGSEIKEKQKSPLEGLHEGKAPILAKELAEYAEGATSKTKLGGLEALVTEFTFKKPGLWGNIEMVGKRATAIHSERRISLLYYCPKVIEAQLEPTFAKIAATLQFNAAAG